MTTLKKIENFNPTTEPKEDIQHSFNLNAISEQIKNTPDIKTRLHLAQDWVKANLPSKTLALTSSFGVQAVILLDTLHKVKLDIPVFSVDIQEEKYTQQREYRHQLHKELPLVFHTFSAGNDDKKVKTLDHSLQSSNIGATISGARASQTAARAKKKFVEWKSRNHMVEFNLLLDWTDEDVEAYIQNVPEYLRHPDYKPGARSKGGVVLSDEEEKTECGLHDDFIANLIKKKNALEP